MVKKVPSSNLPKIIVPQVPYICRHENLFKGEKKNNLNIGVKGGSFSTINPSLLWEHRFNERISSSISTEYMYTSGRYKFTYAKKDGYDTTAVRQNGDVRMLRLENAFFGKSPKENGKPKHTYTIQNEDTPELR